MPEIIKHTSSPMKDAVAEVLKSGYDSWSCTGWTTAGQAGKPHYVHGADTDIVSPLSSPPNNTRPSQPNLTYMPMEVATSGMRGVATNADGKSRNFTIRLDWDFEAEENNRPDGKGFHINVELPDKKFAFCKAQGTKAEFFDRVQMLSERRLHDGDAAAAVWYMERKN